MIALRKRWHDVSKCRKRNREARLFSGLWSRGPESCLLHSELWSTWQNLIARVGYLISLAGHTSRCSVSSSIPVKFAITPPRQAETNRVEFYRDTVTNVRFYLWTGSQFKKREKNSELKLNTCEDSFRGTCSIAWHDEVDLGAEGQQQTHERRERREQTGESERNNNGVSTSACIHFYWL